MSDQKGWVSLHRKLLDNPIFKNPKMLQTFLYCLLKATHEDYQAIVGDTVVELKPGQLVTGVNKISEGTGLTTQNVRTALKNLKTLGILTIKPTTKFSVISIACWDDYQSSNKQITNKQQTTNKQLTTYNNTNNTNNNNNSNKRAGFIKPTLEEVTLQFQSKGLNQQAADNEADTFINFYEAKGWMIGKNKMKSWKAAVANWMKRDNRNGQDQRRNQPGGARASSFERAKSDHEAITQLIANGEIQ